VASVWTGHIEVEEFLFFKRAEFLVTLLSVAHLSRTFYPSVEADKVTSAADKPYEGISKATRPDNVNGYRTDEDVCERIWLSRSNG